MNTMTTMCTTPAAARLRAVSTFGGRDDAWTGISQQLSVRLVPNHGTGVAAVAPIDHNYNASAKQGRPPREVRR